MQVNEKMSHSQKAAKYHVNDHGPMIEYSIFSEARKLSIAMLSSTVDIPKMNNC